MIGSDDTPTPEMPAEARDKVIEHLYEAVIDPTRFEDLMDHWQSMIHPLRRDPNGTLLGVDLDAEFSSHFNRADKFLEKLMDNPDQVDHLAQVDKSAAFLVGPNLTIIDANKAAQAVLGIAAGSKVSDLPIEPADRHELEQKIATMQLRVQDLPSLIRARLQDTRRLILFQLQSDASPLVVVVTSEISWPDGFDVLLKSAFTLTGAEIDIIRALTECLSLREIAEARGRSIDTVRAQLKSALAKTETRSQTELVRLALSMMDITSFSDGIPSQTIAVSEGTSLLEPRPFYELILRDGRKMEYLILGDPNGKPIVFMPQDYGLVRWPASAEAEAMRRGLKIIVQIRPGYGNSTPLQKRQPPSETIGRDLLELLTHLKVDSFPIVSLGGDIFHALAFHQKNPGRVTVIIACGGAVPLETSAQYERMDKWYRFILASARYTPHLMPFMVKAGFSLARCMGKHKFVLAVFGGSKADVATFENPEVYEAMVSGSEVCLSKTHSAHVAFANEILEQERINWTPLLEHARNTVPLHYVNGLQDPQVPEKTLREFQVKHPWINFTDHSDAGQLVFFLKWPEIIPLIEKY